MGTATYYRTIIFGLVCFLTAPALAERYSAGPNGVQLGNNTLRAGPSSTVSTEEEQALIQQALCEALARNEDIHHKPGADVLYDASENKLDMPSPYMEPPLTLTENDIKIPLRIPLIDYLNTPSAYNLNMQEVFIEPGTLNFRDGQLYLDDKRLPRDMSELARACEAKAPESVEE